MDLPEIGGGPLLKVFGQCPYQCGVLSGTKTFITDASDRKLAQSIKEHDHPIKIFEVGLKQFDGEYVDKGTGYVGLEEDEVAPYSELFVHTEVTRKRTQVFGGVWAL